MASDIERIAVLENELKTINTNFDRMFAWQERHDEKHNVINNFITATQAYIDNQNKLKVQKEEYKLNLSRGMKLVSVGSVLAFIGNIILMVINISLLKDFIK